MKLIRNAFALGIAATAVSLAACSSQHGSTVGEPGSGTQVGINSTEHGATGSVGMHLTIGNGVHVNALNWNITNGTTSYSGTIFITDDAGNEAQSIEFVAGGVQAGGNYVITLSGADSNGDPCTGTSMPVAVTPGATSAAVVIVTCTVPTDASLATPVDSGNIAVDAGVVLVSQNPFVCPGITGVSISPAELLPPETAALTAGVTGSSGGTQTLVWSTSCAGANIANPTSPNATFACGSTTPGSACSVTLTVGLNGTGPDGGSVGPVCTNVGVSTTTETIVCEQGGGVACFAPTPTNCSGTCVNEQTDVNHCGSCTTVCSSGQTCTAGVCVNPPGTACTTAPCAASGPNSVQCPGSATSNGVCTPTEAAIVARDIAQGNLTAAGQLKPFVNNTSTAGNGSCYTCLNAKACLDDNAQDTGNECADSPDLSGGAAGSGVTECLTTLNCILGSDCQGAGGIANTSAVASQENVQLCYCGGNNAGSVCSTAGTGTNGLCVNQEAAGFGFAFSDNKDILANYGNQELPSGIANAIFQCATSQKCTICQ